MKRLVVIRGAGELATGIALRLFKVGYRVLLLEKKFPSAIRRSVVFGEAVYDDEKTIDRVTCYKALDAWDAEKRLKDHQMTILVDPNAKIISDLKPFVLVDAIYTKRNMGTTMDMAPLTIGIGPGFIAGKDVHTVIETNRGHNLGNILHSGQAMQEKENFEARVAASCSHTIIAPFSGTLVEGHALAMFVERNEHVVTLVGEDNTAFEIKAPIAGVLRGLLHDGCPVKAGLKIAEIDPSTRPDNCFTISAKSRCIAGSVLEEVVAFENKTSKKKKFSFLS